MKVAIVLVVAMLAVAFARPAEESLQSAKTLKSEFEQSPDGAYNTGFETDNGIKQNQVGELKSVKDEEGKDQIIVAMRGSFSYPDPQTPGSFITVNYFADETGFHADGAHLPKVEQH